MATFWLALSDDGETAYGAMIADADTVAQAVGRAVEVAAGKGLRVHDATAVELTTGGLARAGWTIDGTDLAKIVDTWPRDVILSTVRMRELLDGRPAGQVIRRVNPSHN